jgi:plasmid stabilization system protein ParE
LIVRRPAFDEDLVGQAVFIGRDSPEAGLRLFDAVDETLATLARMPRIGRRVPVDSEYLRGLRMRAVTGFPNQIVFHRATRDGIECVRLLHAARDQPSALRDV